MMLTDYTWFSASGNLVSVNDIIEDIKITNNSNKLFEIHVGTDSDPHGNKYANATGIAIRFPGSGCRYYWTRTYLDPYTHSSLIIRLNAEVTQTIFIADALRRKLNNLYPITVHIDCNPDPKHSSGKYIKQLKSYAVGMGFDVVVKPDSWAASCIADKHAKKTGL